MDAPIFGITVQVMDSEAGFQLAVIHELLDCADVLRIHCYDEPRAVETAVRLEQLVSRLKLRAGRAELGAPGDLYDLTQAPGVGGQGA